MGKLVEFPIDRRFPFDVNNKISYLERLHRLCKLRNEVQSITVAIKRPVAYLQVAK